LIAAGSPTTPRRTCTYTAVAAGELDVVSDTVERTAGHAPYSAERWLREHPDGYAHLR
jgi:NAD(P)H dehydrogenase (quinone)